MRARCPRSKCRCLLIWDMFPVHEPVSMVSGVLGGVVFVQLAGAVGGHSLDPHVQGDHELGQLFAIDETDVLVSGGDRLGSAPGCVGEVGRRDEQAPGGAMRVETAGEVAYLRLSDRLRPAFGLDVDAVKTEGVRVDDAVDAAVSGASEMLGSSIADSLKEIEDGLLEALGLEVDKGVEDVGLVRSEWRGVRSERLLTLRLLGWRTPPERPGDV